MKDETVNCLGNLNRVTAETIKAYLQMSNGASSACQRFEDQNRTATRDKAASNVPVETDLIKDRGGKWTNEVNPCDQHVAHTCETRALKLVEVTVSGYLNLSLGLNMGGTLDCLQESLDLILDKKPLEEHHAECPKEFTDYRWFFIKKYLKGVPNEAEPTAVLNLFPWRDL